VRGLVWSKGIECDVVVRLEVVVGLVGGSDNIDALVEK
jgi:hypothetical protein